MRKRTVITGIGILSSIGNGKEQFINGLVEGVCGTDRVRSFDIEEYPVQMGAEIKDFQTENYGVFDLQNEDTTVQKAVCAVKEALEDSGILSHYEPFDIGVSVATSLGGVNSRENYYRDIKAGRAADPSLLLKVPTSCIAGNISEYFGVNGPNYTVVTACAAGGNALGIAKDLISEGKVKAMIAGGVDPFSAVSFSGFTVLRSLSKSYTRPFNKDRDGLTLGEASAFLILEEMESAVERGAHIYAELLGYGISNDAYHMTSPDPNGGGAYRSMTMALEEAGLLPQDISYVNAHGTGTPYNDQMELATIEKVFGESLINIPISSSKSQFGHTLGTAGAIEAIVCALAISNDFTPPTIHSTDPINHQYNFVQNKSQNQEVNYALSNSFAFGGNTATLVLGKSPRDEK
ncbi:beta-ketoacyl synthase [Metabacillus halosaccharovorans]|uniref:beta-ketoacyl-[acyl-carrier-protein] synthase family protein n=1 Tax=Metabacillus halosaccharovorans TaxID=930124 RepID=UPI0034CDFD1D